MLLPNRHTAQVSRYLCFLFAVGVFSTWSWDAKASDTMPYLRFPDIHGNRLTFVCRGDLWTATIGGEVASRLTATPGREYFPKFSPNGRWLAYTAETSGSPQVWVLPADGGQARQLTYYPSRDGFYYDDAYPSKIGYDHQVVGWSADGQQVLFRSARKDVGWWTARFFAVPLAGGLPEPLALAEGGTLSVEPGAGRRLAFTRTVKEFNLSESWKGYRGGMAPEVWLFDQQDDSLERLTNWPGTDHHPVWTHHGLYYLSDRVGTMNLFRWDDRASQPRQVTTETTWDLRWPGTDGRRIVVQRGGDLLLFDPETETTGVLSLDVPCRPAVKPLDASPFIQSAAVSAKGKLAITARGAIFVVQNDRSSLLLDRPTSRERDVAWSHEGTQLAWIGDAGGRESLWVMGADGRRLRRLTQEDLGPLRRPKWAPDGRHIAFHNYGGTLFVVHVESGRSSPIATSDVRRIDNYVWTPDGTALIWEANIDSDRAALYGHHLKRGQNVTLSDPRFSDASPAMGRDGHLYFTSKRHIEPQIGWIEYDYTLSDLDQVFRIDAALLERAWHNSEPSGSPSVPLAARARQLAVAPGSLDDLAAANGALLYHRQDTRSGRTPGLYSWDLERQVEQMAPENVRMVALSPGGRLLAMKTDDGLGVFDAAGDFLDAEMAEWLKPSLTLPAREPYDEWRQIVREGWRWQRALHYFREASIDWDGLLAQYLPLVARATGRDDINDILGELIAELGIGHLYARGGDIDRSDTRESTGLLGLELEATDIGRYRVKTVLGSGLLAIDGVRSPWSYGTHRVRAGDYLLSIDGQPLSQPMNPYRLLAGRRDDRVVLELARGPALEDRWLETIETLSSEAPLRYADWIEHNRSAVLEATGGAVGYIHIPNFDTHGLAIFVQQYYSERQRAGLIIDTRFADGGYLAEAILQRLGRRSWGLSDCRSCGRWTYPTAAFDGKLVLLADRYSSSDGDLFAYFFKQLGLGPVIGTRTWGGIIGGHTLELVDGGQVSSADNAVTNLEGVPEVENRGVQPDIEVDRLPTDFARGQDRQLQVAIEEMQELLRNQTQEQAS